MLTQTGRTKHTTPGRWLKNWYHYPNSLWTELDFYHVRGGRFTSFAGNIFIFTGLGAKTYATNQHHHHPPSPELLNGSNQFSYKHLAHFWEQISTSECLCLALFVVFFVAAMLSSIVIATTICPGKRLAMLFVEMFIRAQENIFQWRWVSTQTFQEFIVPMVPNYPGLTVFVGWWIKHTHRRPDGCCGIFLPKN